MHGWKSWVSWRRKLGIKLTFEFPWRRNESELAVQRIGAAFFPFSINQFQFPRAALSPFSGFRVEYGGAGGKEAGW